MAKVVVPLNIRSKHNGILFRFCAASARQAEALAEAFANDEDFELSIEPNKSLLLFDDALEAHRFVNQDLRRAAKETK